MAKKLKLYILGEDRSLLTNVVSKLNESRPVEATLFTELKEFLAITMSDPADIFAVSMDFPHPKVNRFPKVFKMAMNFPVIAFAETAESKSRKAVSACQADHKISGKINAHNLWMKILNYQREEEKQEDKGSKNKGSSFVSDSSSSNEKTNPMASFFSQLNSENEGGTQKNYNHIKSESSEPNFSNSSMGMNLDDNGYSTSQEKKSIHIKSTKATKFRKNQANNVTNLIPSDAYLDENEEGYSSGDSILSNNKDDGLDPNNNYGSGNSFDPSELNSLMNGGFMESEDSSFDDEININNHLTSSRNKNFNEPGNQKEGDSDNISSDSISIQSSKSEDFSQKGTEMTTPSKAPTEQDDIDNKIAQLLDDKAKREDDDFDEDAALSAMLGKNPLENTDEEDSLGKEKKSADSLPQKTPLDSKEDQIEAKNEEKKESKPLSKEEKEKEFKRKVSILEEACKKALPECFPAKPFDQPRAFDLETMVVFSINQPTFKGYIIFSNSFNAKEDRSQISEMESKISDYLSEQGMTGGIGNFFEFSVPSVEFTSWVQETCDFTLPFENDAGKQFFLSFLSREKVLPPYTEADLNKDMIRVDLQHIPPNTPVDFDAFIHLPLNKRFVRYLKKERSIGLDQAKRLLKDTEHKRLYVPKSEKQKFIQFYIKNAIYWEIMAYKKQNAA